MNAANDNAFPVEEIWEVNNFLTNISEEYPSMLGNSLWSDICGRVEVMVADVMAQRGQTYWQICEAIHEAKGDDE